MSVSNLHFGPMELRGDLAVTGTLTAGALVGPTTGTHTGPTIGVHTGPVIGEALADADVAFGSFGSAVALAEVPAGQVWVVKDLIVVVEEAFDATTPTIDVGHTGNPDGYIDGGAVDVAGTILGDDYLERAGDLYHTGMGSSRPKLSVIASGDEILAEILTGSGTPTEGSVRVVVWGYRVLA